MKSTWYKVYNYGNTKNFIKKNLTKKSNDQGKFQQQSPQRLADKYKHTSSQNERW